MLDPRLSRVQRANRETEQSFLSQKEDAAATGEQAGNRGVAHVEPAGIGAERRHHQAPAVGDEAGPADAAAASGDRGFRVVVTANFTQRAGCRLMTEHEACGFECWHPFAADTA